MARVVRVVALDVIETLFGLDPIRRAMVEAGLPDRAERWLGQALQDGLAGAAAGTFVPFPDAARHHLEDAARAHGHRDPRLAADRVLAALEQVEPHPDVGPALRRMRGYGLRIVTFTNASRSLSRILLDRADLLGKVERTFDSGQFGCWKPRPEPYRRLARELGVVAGELAVVAAQPWDVHGATTAGCVGAWVDREQRAWPRYFTRPAIRGSSLTEVAEALGGAQFIPA